MEPTTLIPIVEFLVLPIIGIMIAFTVYPQLWLMGPWGKSARRAAEEKQRAKEFVQAEMERQQQALDAQRERDLNRPWTPPPKSLEELEADIIARWTDWQLTRHLVPPEPGSPQFAAEQAAFMAAYLKTAHPDAWSLRLSSRPAVRAATRNGSLLPTKPPT
jgi:hypothetical protein